MAVSIRARHCWRANRFTSKTLSAINFSVPFREPGDDDMCLQKIEPRKKQKAIQNNGLRSARTSE
jgi:hypothetical protein